MNSEDDMSFETAKALIDLASELGLKSIIIIGGEPAIWKHLFEIIG
jgi:molybdenum cofactor biosynthesis enzyme MoaA